MKVHLPIVGKATGSSAGLIYQSYWGNTYTRSFPFCFHYPDTNKQKKCQFDFFLIQRSWWPIYNQLQLSIPKQCRRNTNVYNVLSKGLYSALMTYSEKNLQNIVSVWGLDKRRTVNADFNKISIMVSDIRWIVDAKLAEISSKRNFKPVFYHMLLCNITRQEFYFKEYRFAPPEIQETFIITSEWDRNDFVLVYVALSNDEFFTNFFLCHQ